ncbi:hypothetical protein OQA88_5340 [Cercophora sp. LCS_1]
MPDTVIFESQTATGPLPTVTIHHPAIKTYHKAPYPSISPTLPSLSQSGRTVLIAGGSTGIGFAIARAFVQANASRVILLGRRKNIVEASAAQLASETPAGTKTTVTGVAVDMLDTEGTKRVWSEFKAQGIHVDVLVLNAATTGEFGPILQAGLEKTWRAFEMNVKVLLDWTEGFWRQGGEGKKYLVNVSTSAITNWETDAPVIPAYGLTKNAGTLLLQQIAKDTDVNDMQVVSYYPGGVLTELGLNNGVKEEMYDWDQVELPGQFAVWAATDEAQFAHGRFLATHWDIDELKGEEFQKEIAETNNFLKIGVVGVH